MIKFHLSMFTRSFGTLLFILLSNFLWAQNKTVTGKVINSETGEPLKLRQSVRNNISLM
ncbi:hypothetical protein SAMN05660909_00993 [Chitinophaga terrae (ex Kim and Jung 2007)]|uniref:Uncharacterized protein n=1 Tax=Chitinophaga terrae (ex Kim and Jung 2007) TaxID=408074 RepID=A0A1H3YVZ8_9BACT|nr:hypothetical protein [Chitinophaga terrae (ex Kim and Jung 2007)]SEA15590.1 hypothetical protein SAMN05660909_00993 [Chitinophaga terrae (ex Kim and Jung 2007)]